MGLVTVRFSALLDRFLGGSRSVIQAPKASGRVFGASPGFLAPFRLATTSSAERTLRLCCSIARLTVERSLLLIHTATAGPRIFTQPTIVLYHAYNDRSMKYRRRKTNAGLPVVCHALRKDP